MERLKTRSRKILGAVLAAAAVAALFAYGQLDTAIQSIRFDLRKIGESLYEAHARSGRWPAQIADLKGTAYLRMPYRRDALEREVFVVMWQQDLDPDPQANRERVLAYSHGGLIARLGAEEIRKLRNISANPGL